VLWTATKALYLPAEPDALLATVTKLRMGDRGIGVPFPAEAKMFLLKDSVPVFSDYGRCVHTDALSL